MDSVKQLKLASVLAAAVGVSACSDANISALKAWGDEAVVLAYSGGTLTYAGISTGKVDSESSSDGYYFNDKCQGGKLVEVGGDVNIIRPSTETSYSCNKLPAVQVPLYGME